jgi:hypothetical protein
MSANTTWEELARGVSRPVGQTHELVVAGKSGLVVGHSVPGGVPGGDPLDGGVP